MLPIFYPEKIGPRESAKTQIQKQIAHLNSACKTNNSISFALSLNHNTSRVMETIKKRKISVTVENFEDECSFDDEETNMDLLHGLYNGSQIRYNNSVVCSLSILIDFIAASVFFLILFVCRKMSQL